MHLTFRCRATILVATALLIALAGAASVFSQQGASEAFAGMRWRLIGPFRGGRVVAVTGVPGKPYEYYFGAVGGGVWKTSNSGETWRPIFDSQPTASIGAIAVALSDPNTIYVGAGEADMRSDISFGDGVYKSIDGGATWRNIGLRDSQQIGRILVDPRDANTVLVAALGHGFGPNPERGVYRSADGGATWHKVLGKDDNTGAIDLAFVPGNSHIVYASLWQVRRPPWSVYRPTSGRGSGLYKSSDGGVTWEQITGRGFPSEAVGRIGLAVAPATNGDRVYAVVDAREGGVYRSDDAGQSWKRVSSDRRLWERGWYFGGITADPHDPNVVYVTDTSLYRSTDSGQNFEAIKGAPGGDDYHILWIAPDDPQRMIVGCDQGAVVSVDGGKSWSSWYNQPTAQFYHVITDERFPYMVYGSQQDSGTAGVSSRSDYGQITFRDWSPVGGEESGYIVPDPVDPIVYGSGPLGRVTRFDWTTGQSVIISPQAISRVKNPLRTTWTFPMVASPQNPKVIYVGTQFVLRTEDRGMSWQAISPDLTKKADAANIPGKKEEDRGVVYSIAPSPVRVGEIWAGTDNGFIKLTTDEGKSWTDATPAGLPEWSMVSLIEASHFDAASAYAAVDRHQVDDFHPYIYRTHDYGKSWQNIVAGLPQSVFVHVVREDPDRKGLLFAGTETGVFVSFDDGDHWQPLQLNLPTVSIRDLAIHSGDLIAATHGRAFWILDDIEPLREWTKTIEESAVYLYRPVHALRIGRSENHDTPLPPETPVGENPPPGAILDYNLKSAATGEFALEIRDHAGELVRRYSSEDKPPAIDEPPLFPRYWLHAPQRLSNSAGMHRFVWDLRYSSPLALHYEYSMGAPIHSGTVPEPQGPLALPGVYEVRLSVGGTTLTQKLTVEIDPREQISLGDLAKQLELERKIDAALTQTTEMHRRIADFRMQLRNLKERLAGNSKAAEISALAGSLDDRADHLQGRAVEWDEPQPTGGLTELDGSLASLAISIGSGDSAPTAQALAAFGELEKQLHDSLAAWDELKREAADLNKRLQDAGVTPMKLDSSR